MTNNTTNDDNCMYIYCIQMCIYIYIYIYIYLWPPQLWPRLRSARALPGGAGRVMSKFIYIYIYIYTHECVYVCVYIYIYICTYIHASLSLSIYIYTHKYFGCDLWCLGGQERTRAWVPLEGTKRATSVSVRLLRPQKDLRTGSIYMIYYNIICYSMYAYSRAGCHGLEPGAEGPQAQEPGAREGGGARKCLYIWCVYSVYVIYMYIYIYIYILFIQFYTCHASIKCR